MATVQPPTNRPLITGVRLEAANGDMLPLDGKDAATTVTLDGVQLHNDRETLRFEGKGNNAARWNAIVVPAKLDYKVVLADGSKVWLNASTKLRFPFTFPNDIREVFVDGEAYFDIAPDADRPFVVNVGGSRLEVLGTEFNVNNYGGKAITTSLVKGAVAVNSKAERVVLQPGKEAILTNNGKVKVHAFDPEEATSWMHGVYTFHNTPLSVLSEVLPRMFGTQVVFDKREIGEIRFTGALDKNDPLSYFLRNLEVAAEVQSYYANGVLHLK
ncbi:FecR domain-containing protein [Chitinophaga horti]|uniref:FecR domain-containing protein n=1 Tax=Chitinophaga horti TaxID=2920382 RepID=A0ABY6J579_9BACT|nr:FecR domain-containing protein [Chitinophaga horti]UYQ94835.1 FecR domain-containing protein [Chitinophaga horti]